MGTLTVQPVLLCSCCRAAELTLGVRAVEKPQSQEAGWHIPISHQEEVVPLKLVGIFSSTSVRFALSGSLSPNHMFFIS